ncbi:MAG: MoaF N-terminal domain-containing protein [Lachnospiraceae bacterium]|jgi:hypothetical protein|nr:MoaF N-terminal domain-containing protein [Lachnospiraceae bacterium]
MAKSAELKKTLKYFTKDGTPLELVMDRTWRVFTEDGGQAEIAEREGPLPRMVTKSYTKEEVQKMVDSNYATDDGGAQNKEPRPFTDALAGKSFEFYFDKGVDEPVTLTYRFETANKLYWSGHGRTEELPAYYEALNADDTVIMVHHLRRGSEPIECITLFIDTESYLTTCCYHKLGNDYEAREVSRTFWFGAAKKPDGTFPEGRQGYSDYLVGKTIRWEYFVDEPNMNHIYMSNTFSACCVILPKKGRGFGGAFPSRYVGLKDTLHIYSWVEELGSGTHGMVCIDFRNAADEGKVHDVGCFFGFSVRDDLEFFTYAGPGKLAPLGVINEDYSH